MTRAATMSDDASPPVPPVPHERALAELAAALARAERRHLLAAEAARAIFYDFDVRSGLSRRTGAIESILGYGPDAQSPHVDWWTSLVHPDDASAVAAVVARALRDGGEFSADYRMRARDGAWVRIRDRAVLERDAAGRAVRMVGVAQDVTDRLLLEQELVHARRSEAVGRLASAVAHEFNDQVTSILGFVELARGAPTWAVGEHLDRIRDAALGAARLARELLSCARPRRSGDEAFDVDAAVRAAAPLLRRLLGDRLPLTEACHCGGARVRFDHERFESLLLAMAGNLREASPDAATARLVARRTGGTAAPDGAAPAPHGYVEVSFSAERAEGAAPGDARPRGGAAGVGLSGLAEDVAAAGGVLRFEPLPTGAAYRLTLPAVEAPAAAATVAGDADGAAPAGGRCILVAEDDPLVRDMVERALRGAGYDVVAADCGAEALRALDHGSRAPHLLLTDVVLPDLDGRDVAAAAVARRPDLPVVFMSGYVEAAAERPFPKGAPFLPKPFATAALLRLLRSTFEAASAGATACGE